MGKQGFLTQQVKLACQRVTNHVVPKRHLLKQQSLRKVLVVLMLLALYIPYGFLVHSQWDSQYLCSRLYIQLSGEAIPNMAYYTGHFEVHKEGDEIFGGLRSRIHDRVYYKDRTGNLIVAYCASETAWTISLNTTDHCTYLYKSSSTTDFDIAAVEGMTWYAWDLTTQRALPVDFYMRCDDCDDGPRGNCHLHNGYCQENKCVCNENRTGAHCNNVLPACEKVHVDARSGAIPAEEGVRRLRTKFQPLFW